MTRKKCITKPISITIFQEKYSNEEACRDYLFSLRYPNGYVCLKCGCTEYYEIDSRHKYQCRHCRHQTSVTSGTVMDRSHLKLTVWLWAMYLFVTDKRGCSAMYISKVLHLPYKTAWFLLQRLRSAMSERENRYMLDGIIELDDTYVGAPDKNAKRGRGTTKMKIVVAVSKTDNGRPQFAKMQVVPNLKGITIGKFAKQNIAEGATVETDGYHSLRKPLADKYMHSFKTFKADGSMLKWLHTIISNAKSFIGGTYHGMERKHIQLYLNEFCYRFNRRFIDNLFERLAIAALNAGICRLDFLLS